jgi:2-haloacid dehalogenase
MHSSGRKLLTFDCYNTLVDTSPIADALCSIAQPYSLQDEASRLRDIFYRVEYDLMYGAAFFTLKELLARSLQAALQSFGVTAADNDAETLVDCYRAFEPFDDVPAVMEHLSTRFDLCIMSNSDDDIISYNAKSIGIPFKHIFTAEQLRCYKPSIRFFEHVHRALHVDSQNHTHIAAGFWWDIIPGKKLHWRRIWVNRQGDTGDEQYQPYTEVHDFRRVPEVLAI